MKTKLLSLLCIAGFMLFSTNLSAQTTLVPGDIAVIWHQTDTEDAFAFVTFVDLAPGTVIYFTDCGVVPAGTFDPLGCGEGAVAYTVPTGGLNIGDIVKWEQPTPAPEFANYSLTGVINGGSGLGLSTGGDQVLVFQESGNPAGSVNAAANPVFIFINNIASTLFTGDDSVSTTETGMPIGLSDVGLPRTALGIGAGPGPSQEFDNSVFIGPYGTYATIADAKIAVTDPANYSPSNAIATAPYSTNVFVLQGTSNFVITTLSTEDFNVDNIKMYPNPAQSYITISGNHLDINEVRIFDITGKEVINTKLLNNQVDISQLQSGMYLVNIIGDNVDVFKKLIKL